VRGFFSEFRPEAPGVEEEGLSGIAPDMIQGGIWISVHVSSGFIIDALPGPFPSSFYLGFWNGVLVHLL